MSFCLWCCLGKRSISELGSESVARLLFLPGIVNDFLKSFLEMNLPGKKSKTELGVGDKTLGGSIKQELGYDVVSNEMVTELIRGIRLFAEKLLKPLKDGDLDRAQLGLGHSYSRAKVKFNVNRADNMIIQAISLLDQLDKDINTFSMRVRCVSYLFWNSFWSRKGFNHLRLTFPGNGTAGTSPNWSRSSTTTTCTPNSPKL